MDELLPVLKQLYKNDAERIFLALQEYGKVLPVIEKPDPNRTWYKYINLYFVYPDSITSQKSKPIRSLIPHLAHIKDLGCNAVHILPFLDSPMIDKGFDVSDYLSVRKKLGTIPDLKLLMAKAEKLGLKIFMDLVFNHVSDQHEWYKKAIGGDEKYRNYFIYQKTKPNFVRKFHKESAVWGEYIIGGKKRAINIAFPEYTGEIAHWREGADGYWYYHTYYPQQPDVNWRNPDVFIEFAKIIMYWGSLGFNFRLDAIPFVGKSAYKEVDNNTDFTRTLMASFSCIAESINPEAVFIMETYEKEDTVIDYFGSTNVKQAKLGYNFHLCTYMWVAIVKENASYIWKKLERLDVIPTHAEWINFLRNHDELSLAYLSDTLLKDIKDDLMEKGAPFREGYGISGRTYSLLGQDLKKYLASYLLLASMPGGILIPYGDEFGKKNIPISKLSKLEKHDTRNINRGILTQKEMRTPKAKFIKSRLKEFLEKRQFLREYLNIWPEKLQAPKEVFAGYYQAGSSKLVFMINLSDKEQRVKFASSEFTFLIKHERITIKNREILLSPYAGVWLQK